MKKWEKQTMKIAALGAMALTLAGCATAKSSSSQGNNPGKTIKIGVNMELSGSAAGYGEQQKEGYYEKENTLCIGSGIASDRLRKQQL